MATHFPSGTVTFLFTDVEGSTKLLHELGAADYAAALLEHRRVLRAAFSQHGGVEVDTQGDAFFYAFPTAPGALAAAREATEALGDGPIRVRIGLHTGTPLVTAEGYIGPDVHRAARSWPPAMAASCWSAPPPPPCSVATPACATSESTGSRTCPPPSASSSSARPTTRRSRHS